MKIQNSFDKTLVDFMLLHGCFIENPGLMTGKAGLVLGLFEATYIDKRVEIEEIAFDFLQEVLAWEFKEYSFKRGKAGVVCGLLYLIENGFIECDFQELYGAEFKETLCYVKKLDIKKTNVDDCIGYIIYLFVIKDKITISEFEEIWNILSLILDDYCQFIPKNPIELRFFYCYAAKIFAIYNLIDNNYRHYLEKPLNSILTIHMHIQENAYICINIKFAFQLFRYSKICKDNALFAQSQSLMKTIFHNSVINALSLEEIIDQFYIIKQLYNDEDRPDYVESIYKQIESLFTYNNLISTQSVFHQTKLQSLVALESGIPKFILMRNMSNLGVLANHRNEFLFI
ncbi:hypothetical protein [Bacteroides acidifaciens]|uniref:hypothetical protein n=1 Tax=Bacteroides acidifaciens TaxID=85831 RepID=UPI003014B267